MKVVVFGSTGVTGKLVVEQLLARNHEVVAYVRNPAKLEISNDRLTVVQGSLTDAAAIKNAVSGSDAIVSTLGSLQFFSVGQEVVEGIKNVVAAMEETGVKRIVYMSSMGCGDSYNKMSFLIRMLLCNVILRYPLQTHTICENALISSNLDYTIFRPGGLADGPVQEGVKTGTDAEPCKASPINRATVASTIIKELEEPNFVRQTPWCFM